MYKITKNEIQDLVTVEVENTEKKEKFMVSFSYMRTSKINVFGDVEKFNMNDIDVIIKQFKNILMNNVGISETNLESNN